MNNKIYILFSLVSLLNISVYGMDKTSQNTNDNAYENVHLFKNDNRLNPPYRMQMPQAKIKHVKEISQRTERKQDRRRKIDRLSGRVS